jgi:hypothetical protein
MVSLEVERTLVKSPPELWTELGNPDTLARHLGEFGDIRITRIDPEHAVEWEAGNTAGTVRIKPSGWGTKVTLTATREAAVPAREVAAQPVPAAPEPPEVLAAADAAPAPVASAEPEIEAHGPEQATPREAEAPTGFLRRLFGGRRRRHADAAQPPPVFSAPHAAEPEPAVDTPPTAATSSLDAPAPAQEPSSAEDVLPADERREDDPPRQPADISAELKAAEETAAEEVTAVLTSVLDRLGAAHHRPFSRA